MTYEEFLAAKIPATLSAGIEPGEVNPLLKPHQRDIVQWAVRGGRRAIFASFGLGKSFMQLEIARLIQQQVGGRFLIVAPLGVRLEFMADADKLGIDIRFVRRLEECEPTGIYLTNYETIRDGKLDPKQFVGASLDEASVLRGFGGTKTFREFMRLFEGLKYKFVATATPSPNEYIELLAYSAFLEVMDVGEAKTRFFKRNSEKADQLTIHPHKAREFWLWCASWGILLNRPSDLGYSDEGYDLPEMEIHWHEVPTDHEMAGHEISGQGRLIKKAAVSLTEVAREKRESLSTRIAKLNEIRALDPEAHKLIWHDLEREREAIEKNCPGVVTVWGNQDLEEREARIAAFSRGEIAELATKPVIAGSGCNLQKHCAWAIFLGIGFKFNDFIQAIHRIHRFLQPKRVRIDLIYTEAEVEVRRSLERKWQQHKEITEEMSKIIREFGLADASLRSALSRSLGVSRVEASGENWIAVNNDCVLETRSMPDASVDLIVTSIPFSTQYEYTPNYCYDEATEVLTRRGWLSFADVAKDDLLATVELKSCRVQWQAPSGLIWERYRGPMLHFENRCNFDLLVTPDHSMVVDERVGNRVNGRTDKRYKKVRAEDIANDFVTRKWRMLNHVATGEGTKPASVKIPKLDRAKKGPCPVQLGEIPIKDFLELAGWYLSEGCADALSSSHAGRVCISQTGANPGYRKEIISLVRRLGLGVQIQERSICFHNKELAAYLREQFGVGSRRLRIPRWIKDLDASLLTILRDTMMKGDGSKTGYAYVSYSPTLRDDFQEICILTGWRATISGTTVGIGQKQVYPEIRVKPQLVQYTGMIGCAKVPNGTLIVRRNGVPIVSGNCDFGHSDSNEHFFEQMDYLTPELLRVIKPGRIAAIHVKDRIVPGGINKLGFQTVYPFHCVTIEHFQRHGWAYMGMKTIVTDVVRENNQTYRLGWSEQCKDATKMGCGMPEYLLLFRRPPTDTSNSYADDPVRKSKPNCLTPDGEAVPFDRNLPIQPNSGYSRSRWQIDAHGFTRSSGDRPLMPQDWHKLKHDQIFGMFRDFQLQAVYDFEYHVQLCETLEAQMNLPVTFMLLQPPSWHADVWSDVTRMLTLNGRQYAKGKEMHLCLARNSLVLTKERGYVPIQDVQVGEHTLTHKGRWRKVLIVRNTGDQPVVTVRAQGVPGLTVTPDHKLWTRKTDWVRERDGAERSEPAWIEAQFTKGAYLNLKVPGEENVKGDVTLWWTVGRWLADGHIDKRGCAIISCGRSKWEVFSEKIGRFGGNTPHEGTALQLRLKDPDRQLRNILQRCGHGAAGKHLPPEAFLLSKEQRAALLNGYLAGDGHFVAERGRWMATSVSRPLLMGLAVLAQQAHGVIATINPGKPAGTYLIEGREVQTKQEWVLSFDLPIKRRRKPFILEDGAWKKVSSLEAAGVQETWCLKVEEDESFTAEGCIVKNCPMQFDIADRCIEQFSMPGEVVFDPFGGLMTTPYRAVLKGRKGIGVELNHRYWLDGCAYLKSTEDHLRMPSLFDAIEAGMEEEGEAA